MKESIKAFILITLILVIGAIICSIYFNDPVVLLAFAPLWLISPIFIGFLEDK